VIWICTRRVSAGPKRFAIDVKMSEITYTRLMTQAGIDLRRLGQMKAETAYFSIRCFVPHYPGV